MVVALQLNTHRFTNIYLFIYIPHINTLLNIYTCSRSYQTVCSDGLQMPLVAARRTATAVAASLLPILSGASPLVRVHGTGTRVTRGIADYIPPVPLGEVFAASLRAQLLQPSPECVCAWRRKKSYKKRRVGAASTKSRRREAVKNRGRL